MSRHSGLPACLLAVDLFIFLLSASLITYLSASVLSCPLDSWPDYALVINPSSVLTGLPA